MSIFFNNILKFLVFREIKLRREKLKEERKQPSKMKLSHCYTGKKLKVP